MKNIQSIFVGVALFTAFSASAQSIGLDLDAQRESVNGGLFSWKIMLWVLVAALAGWAGVYFIGGSGGSDENGGDDKGGDDKK